MPAKPYKDAHLKLVAGIGTADKYAGDWKAIADDLNKLVIATGFDPKGNKVPGLIRAKVAGPGTEAATLRAGANAPTTATGADLLAGNKRALSLKTLRHLYFHDSFGKQKVWILSLPGILRGFPMDYQTGANALIDQVLNAGDEKFSATTMKDLSEACQLGLAWVQKALMVAGAPMEHENRKLFRRWFIPADMKDESTKIPTFAATLKTQLIKIADGLKKGEVILTDSPQERGSNSSLEQAEAFVFPGSNVITVFVESAFFSTGGNTLTGKTNWARIIVHELTHAYAGTKDHSYSWQGLLPRDSDLLKKGEDARIVASPGWKAVRSLSYDECTTNADSWAFFIADCAGALSESDRMQALGKRIYDRAGETMEKGLEDKMKVRAA